MAATFAPPHPPPVFRVLKQAWREYLASNGSNWINVTTPPNQAATATTTVAGSVEVDRASGATLPASVTVELKQGATTKGTQTATVNPTTGAYTTTFAANTLAAGPATATVTIASPFRAVITPPFTVT